MNYNLDLFEKNVLVTGGAGGIGLSCAKGFLENKAAVILCDLSESALEKAEKELLKLFKRRGENAQ